MPNRGTQPFAYLIGYGIGYPIGYPITGGGSGGASFSPTDISGLALWLDAADTATITHSGGSVSQWDDKSGNNYHATQPTGSVQPITGTRTINGRNVLDFVAGLSYMSLPSGMLSFGVNDWTHIVVLATDTTVSAQRVISGIGTGSALTHGVFYNTSNIANARQGVGISASSSGVLNTNVNILSGRRSGSTLKAHLNGNELTGSSGSAVNDTLTSFTIGSTTTTVDGRIAEILSYSRSITDNEHNLIDNYLAGKWGVSSINF